MYTFDVKGGQLESILQVSATTVASIVHHPHRNLIATIGDSGKVKLWKP
jgi:WD40 repeat-containing protein SMU1